MASCLGIHINENIIRYAKFTYNPKTKAMSVDQHGVKFESENRVETIKKIIEETKSEELPISLSTFNDHYQKIQVFRQLSKPDMLNVINLEFEDWCEKNSLNSNDYLYTYFLPDVTSGDYYYGMLNIVKKQQIELYSSVTSLSIDAIYPAPFTINRLVPKEENDYTLINLDEKTYIISVVEGKVSEIAVEDIGMKEILEKFSELTGSYSKAYEACKQINVFYEGKSPNLKEFEVIVEPVLQEVLKRASDIVKKHRKATQKIILTGLGTLFTNIDILFREFFEIKTEILKPDFMSSVGDVRNIAELLEATPAIAIAYEQIVPNEKTETIEYFRKVKEKGFKAWLKKLLDTPKKKKEKNEIKKDEYRSTMVSSKYEKLSPVFINFSIVLTVFIIAYLIFGNIYYSQIDKMQKDINKETAKVLAKISAVNSDISYVNSNKNGYKEINDDINDIVSQIENNEIGASSSYYVANFLQKIIKIIPKELTLKTITSNENKNIVIKTESSSYASLGYFVAQLKLQGILNNVEVKTIANGTVITVEIGGDLP